MDDPVVECIVYRSHRRRETYLYLPSRVAPEEALPEDLRRLLGRVEPVMTLRLTPEHRLARAEARSVIQALKDQGYYLQLPPPV